MTARDPLDDILDRMHLRTLRGWAKVARHNLPPPHGKVKTTVSVIISLAQARGLRILKDDKTLGQNQGHVRGVWPRLFAEKMWPDSPSWERYGKCGPNGVTRGVGITQRAGSFLSSLEVVGLARCRYTSTNQKMYSITSAGEQALREFDRFDGRR